MICLKELNLLGLVQFLVVCRVPAERLALRHRALVDTHLGDISERD